VGFEVILRKNIRIKNILLGLMSTYNITKAEEKALIRLTEDSGKWVSVGVIAKRKDFWRAVAECSLGGKRRRFSLVTNKDELV
jgi:hypothetical protein